MIALHVWVSCSQWSEMRSHMSFYNERGGNWTTRKVIEEAIQLWNNTQRQAIGRYNASKGASNAS